MSSNQFLAKLRIVGEGAYAKTLEQLIQKAPTARYGDVGGRAESAIEEMHQAAVCVFIDVVFGRFGLTVIEAMSLAKPVLIFDRPPQNELVTDKITGTVIPEKGDQKKRNWQMRWSSCLRIRRVEQRWVSAPSQVPIKVHIQTGWSSIRTSSDRDEGAHASSQAIDKSRLAELWQNKPKSPTSSISVMVTVLNEQATISRLLEAFGKQTLQPTAVVIVDGGSTDGTSQILKQWRKKSCRFVCSWSNRRAIRCW